MNGKKAPAVVIIVVVVWVLAVMARAEWDRFTVRTPNGVAFSEFSGYETWQAVAPSQTENGSKAILGNPVMINAYKAFIPGNAKHFPDGSMIVKIK
jgi:Cytochrome P460